MEEEKVIQVSVQLPAQALQGFTDMVRQLRQLAAELRGGPRAGAEAMENAAFDEERFLTMQEAPAAKSVRTEAGPGARGPASAARQVRDQVPDPDMAGKEIPSAGEEGDRDGRREERPAQELPDAERRSDSREDTGDIPAVQARADTPVEDPPRAEGNPESAIPEAEAVWARAEERPADPPAASAGETAGPEEPPEAGFQMATGPAAAESRWSGVTEELAAAGPAPLTAEAVSQAFRRDGRRYDNGFPLY